MDFLYLLLCAHVVIFSKAECHMKHKLLKIISVIFGVVIVDQIIKGWLIHQVMHTVPAFISYSAVPVPPQGAILFQAFDFSWFSLYIHFLWNTGTAFSLFRALGHALPIVLIILTGAIIGFLLYYLFKRAHKYECIPLALIVGGAIGNLIDRVRFGAVVDYLHVSIFGWDKFPTFNFADMCVVIGCGLYLISYVIYTKKQKRELTSKEK